MSANINFHGPFKYKPRHYPAGTFENHPEQYGSFGIEDPKGNDLTLYFDTRTQVDAHLKAVLAFRDMFTEQPEAAEEPS